MQNDQDEVRESAAKVAPKSMVVGIVIGIFIASAVVVASLALLKPKLLAELFPGGESVSEQSDTGVPSLTDKSSPETVNPVTDDGISWLAVPQPIDNPGVFTDVASFYASIEGVDPSTLSAESRKQYEESVSYWNVGTDNGQPIILVNFKPNGMDYNRTGLIEKTATGYRVLVQHSPALYGKDMPVAQRLAVASTVTIDRTTNFRSLAYQQSLTIDGKILTGFTESYFPTNDITKAEDDNPSTVPYRKRTKVSNTLYGTLYEERYHPNDSVGQSTYYLVRPNFTEDVYQLKPLFLSDDFIPQVTWQDGTKNEDTYRIDGGGGCGLQYGYMILSDAAKHTLATIGTTRSGERVYGFTNTDDSVVKSFYESYATPFGGREDTIISVENYLAQHNLFVYKDALDRSILFVSDKYGPQVECGKPVIYLYPTQSTNVSVSVDATITKSEPNYQSSWQVLAEPNGQLTVNGRKYDSLFWEGTGHGSYPTIQSGFVVAHTDLQSTIVNHLEKLGLNEKERADFLAFWLPKLPKTPFVRLTWFGTRQMDELAPLTVLPKPDTNIRIFLDFEGLEAPITLPAQHLSAPARRGFTLVEWGGLLRH